MMGLEVPATKEEVERRNDAFARAHDIDAYYQRSDPVTRLVEGRRLSIIRRMMRARPGERILEVGCGGGHVLALFPGCALTGVDVSSEMLARAEKNLAGYDVELMKGELGDIALPSESFDGVVCTEVLEHVVDPIAVLARIHRLVKPDGRVVLTFPNDRLIHRLKAFATRTRLTSLPLFGRIGWGGDEYHIHVWTVREMRALLERHFHIAEEAFAPTRALPIRCCFLCTPRPQTGF